MLRSQKNCTTIPKVSIIVPVYNVSPYLEKCLDSIINQTLKEIEIIIVNDCSEDPQDDGICQHYANNDDRINYTKHSQNLGLGGARNTGISLASAPYIGFVDSDDYIDPELFEVAYNEAFRGGIDIVIFGYSLVYENNDESNIKIPCGSTEGDLFERFLQENVPNPAAWNKLWKRSLFIDNNIQFPRHIYFEDMPVTAKCLYYAKSIKYLDRAFYYYLQRESSIIRSFSKKHIDDNFAILTIMNDFLVSINKVSTYHQQLQNCFWVIIKHHLNTGLALASVSNKEQAYNYLRDSIISSKVVDMKVMLSQLTPIQSASIFGGLSAFVTLETNVDEMELALINYKAIQKNPWYRFGQLSWIGRAKFIFKSILIKLYDLRKVLR